MKERVVLYITPTTLKSLELLRSWAECRSRGEVVDLVVRLFTEEHRPEILAWFAQFQKAGNEREGE